MLFELVLLVTQAVWTEPVSSLRMSVETNGELLVSIQNVGPSVLNVLVGTRAGSMTYGFRFTATAPDGKVCELRTTDPDYFLPIGGTISALVMRLKPGYIRTFPYQYKYLNCKGTSLDKLFLMGYKVRASMRVTKEELAQFRIAILPQGEDAWIGPAWVGELMSR